MLSPIALSFWAERRGEREVYAAMCLTAALGSFCLSFQDLPWPVFVVSWSLLSMPPAIRSVRAAFLAKTLPFDQLCRVGNLCSSSGLAGGLLGPVIATGLSVEFERHDGRRVFTVANALVALTSLPKKADQSDPLLQHRTGTHESAGMRQHRTGTDRSAGMSLSEGMSRQSTANSANPAACALCKTFGLDFDVFSKYLVIAFSITAGLLELSLQASVMALFQPLAVSRFGWQDHEIASVYIAGAGVSCLITLMAFQTNASASVLLGVATGLYLSAVLLVTLSSISEGKLLLALILGTIAQVLFISPFITIFAGMVGKSRITHGLTTILCLAPSAGQVLGAALTPLALAAVDTPTFALVSIPAVLATILVIIFLRVFQIEQSNGL